MKASTIVCCLLIRLEASLNINRQQIKERETEKEKEREICRYGIPRYTLTMSEIKNNPKIEE